MERHEIEALRLAVLANGYTPIRNMDKRTFMPSWPTASITEDEIRSWTRKHSRHAATGLRIENGLVALDFDVDDKATMEALTNAVMDKWPEFEGDDVLVRWGKGAKEAWFLRCDELFTRLHTRAFIKPGQTADDGTHRVEIFGGGSPRQFGAFGPHTIDERTREVLIEYEWAEDRSPATVPFAQLLEVPKKTLWGVVDLCEEVLIGLGWTIQEKSTRGESASGKVYDLVPEMLFECNDDTVRTLDELREAAKAEEGHIRCSASWLEGKSAKRRDRCLVSLARSGHVVIWESMEGVSHHEKSDEPMDYGPMIDRAAEKLLELKERRRTKINGGDEFDVAAAKLLNGFAYCPSQQLSIVPLWGRSLEEGYMVTPFRMMLAPNCKEEKGPRGGVKMVNPVDAWMARPDRVTVDGLRMRPDMPRPVFEEQGKKYVNVYSPPDHRATGGDASTGIEFFEKLLPDADERDWFLKWLCFKIRYPHVPGPAVIMVAHGRYGTGRGTLTELVTRIFGGNYVRQLPFSTFAGKTYQSQYNEWQSEALMVCVNESAEVDSGNGSNYQSKVNTYEHLKDLVEVRQTVREIRRKRDRNYWALSCTTFLIATNHRDALPIPEHDRRFCIMSNGNPQPVAYWQRVNAWMDKPENVAAIYQWLLDYGYEGYSPYDNPPVFDAKADMIDEAKSDLDRALELAVLNMPGEVFTLKQLEKYVRMAASSEGYELPRPFDRVMRKVGRSNYPRVGVRNGYNWHPVVSGERHAVYAKERAIADSWTDAPSADLRAEIARNGDADGGGSAVLKGLFIKKKPEKDDV